MADTWVFEHSTTPGFYVDIGSNDGYYKSKTSLLDNNRWRGLCIAQSPVNYEQRTAQVVTLHEQSVEDILVRCNAPRRIEYLNIEQVDVKSFPFDKYTVKFLTVQTCDGGVRKLLEECGYTFVRAGDWYVNLNWCDQQESPEAQVQQDLV